MFSVIITTYNLEGHVIDCLLSILPQLSANDELIVIDDCSTDRTVELAKSLLNEYPKVNSSCFSNHKNRGPSYSRNMGLLRAKMDRIMFIDGDDTVSPNLFSELSSIVSRNEQCDYIVSGLKTIYINEEIHFVRNRPRRVTTDQMLETNKTLKKYIIEYHQIPYDRFDFTHCWGRLYSRKILLKHGITFNEKINQAEDSLFNFDYLAHSSYLYFSSQSDYYQHVQIDKGLSAQLGTSSQYLRIMTRTAFAIFKRTSKYCLFPNSRIKKEVMRQFIAQILSLGLYRNYFNQNRDYDLNRLVEIMNTPHNKYFNYLKYKRNNSVIFFFLLRTNNLLTYLRLKKALKWVY